MGAEAELWGTVMVEGVKKLVHLWSSEQCSVNILYSHRCYKYLQFILAAWIADEDLNFEIQASKEITQKRQRNHFFFYAVHISSN